MYGKTVNDTYFTGENLFPAYFISSAIHFENNHMPKKRAYYAKTMYKIEKKR